MILMDGSHRLSLEQMSLFVAGSCDLELGAASSSQAREVIWKVLEAQRYGSLSKAAKGTVRKYLMRVTGYGRAQLTRLIRQYWTGGREAPARSKRRFPTRYTPEDVALLARTDSAHQGLSGAATKRLLYRAWFVFQDDAYERLAGISVSHIYNLRASQAYRKHRLVYRRTQSTPVPIGERRCPDPLGSPGWIRIDSVHQGDPRDGHPGIYHINVVDTVTQWQVVGCVETISERHMLPALTALLHQFPFRIRGFHSDNGSEYVNHKVAKLLNKLRVSEFTKSRPNRSTDNALVEGKNGAVIRKHVGYGHIPAFHADAFQRLYTAYLNPYLNFHRPCGFATTTINERGKRRRHYRPEDYRTPYEKLTSLPDWEQHLKPGISAELLARQAAALTDLDSAQRMQQALDQLLTRCRAE